MDPMVCSAQASAYQTAARPCRYLRYLPESLTHMLLVSRVRAALFIIITPCEDGD